MGPASWLSYWIHKEVKRRKNTRQRSQHQGSTAKSVKIGHRAKQQQLFIGLYKEKKERKSRIKTAYTCMRVVGKKKVNKTTLS